MKMILSEMQRCHDIYKVKLPLLIHMEDEDLITMLVDLGNYGQELIKVVEGSKEWNDYGRAEIIKEITGALNYEAILRGILDGKEMY